MARGDDGLEETMGWRRRAKSVMAPFEATPIPEWWLTSSLLNNGCPGEWGDQGSGQEVGGGRKRRRFFPSSPKKEKLTRRVWGLGTTLVTTFFFWSFFIYLYRCSSILWQQSHPNLHFPNLWQCWHWLDSASELFHTSWSTTISLGMHRWSWRVSNRVQDSLTLFECDLRPLAIYLIRELLLY